MTETASVRIDTDAPYTESITPASGSDSNTVNVRNSIGCAIVTEEMMRTRELQMTDRVDEECCKAGVIELEVDVSLMSFT